MLACTFFGHSDCPETIRPNLQAVLIDLIVNQNIEMFYVGNQGQFDAIVRNVLRDLKMDYPAINYAVVLAYIPGKKPEYDDHSDTMLPEGIEWSIHATPSPGATTGCSGSPSMLSLTSPAPGVVQLNMQQKQSDSRKM